MIAPSRIFAMSRDSFGDHDQALEAKATPLHWVPLQASTGVGGKVIGVSGAHREVGIS